MFNFLHPQSVLPRRPVATMVSRQATHAANLPTTLVIQNNQGPTTEHVTPGLPSPLKIAFSVSYARSEYLDFVRAHVTATAVKKGKLGAAKALPLYVRCLLTVMGSIAFYFKRRKMPVCHFEIDADGIRRNTALGLLVLPWSEVVAVDRYAPGLLVSKKSGAMLLPYRCLTQAQIDLLEGFVEAWKSGHPQTASPAQ